MWISFRRRGGPKRRKFIENHSFRRHQRQYFMKFSIFEYFRFHGTRPCCNSTPSLQIPFAIWCDRLKAIAQNNSGKIRLDQTNSQISRISAVCTSTVWKRFSMTIWAKHPGTGIILTADISHYGCYTYQCGKNWSLRVISPPPTATSSFWIRSFRWARLFMPELV